MNKKAKIIYQQLVGMLSEDNAGLLIAMLCDLLNECLDGREDFYMRNIEITINDFFSKRYDFTGKEGNN